MEKSRFWKKIIQSLKFRSLQFKWICKFDYKTVKKKCHDYYFLKYSILKKKTKKKKREKRQKKKKQEKKKENRKTKQTKKKKNICLKETGLRRDDF